MSITASQIPKPVFKTCDETSLKLTWDHAALTQALESTGQKNNFDVRVQYKEIHEPWEKTKEYNIPATCQDGVRLETLLKEADLVDLKPGTPYFVRLVVFKKDDQSLTIGPETVFDTKPIDCTPKKKTCIVS
jgi:hypothetical protein